MASQICRLESGLPPVGLQSGEQVGNRGFHPVRKQEILRALSCLGKLRMDAAKLFPLLRCEPFGMAIHLDVEIGDDAGGKSGRDG